MKINQLIDMLETYKRILGPALVDVTVEKIKEGKDGICIGLKVDHRFEIEEMRNYIKDCEELH